MGINNRGIIVGDGTALDSQGNVTKRAFLSSTTPPFTRTPLGTLIPTGGGTFLGASVARAVQNSNDRVAGDSSPSGGGPGMTPVQFKLGPFGIKPDLLVPAVGSASAFSDAGVIVGFLGADGDPGRRGFAYDTTDGSLCDLTSNLVTPGFTILEATGVNPAGQMSAIASGPGGPRVGVLLSPQP
jgi:hypothetical protein